MGAAATRLDLAKTLQAATRLQGEERLQEAAALYHEILVASPRHLGALCGWGLLCAQTGHDDDATLAFRQAARAADGDVGALANLSKVLTKVGRADEAMAALQRAVALDSRNPRLHFALANQMLASGRIEPAIAHYGQAIAAAPSAAAHNNLGLALQAAGRLDDARQCHERALALEPRLADAHIGLGAIARRRESWREAADHYARALQMAPDRADICNCLAAAQLRAGDERAAIANFKAAAALDPGCAEAHYNLANLFYGKGDHAAAIAEYVRALKARPDFADAYNNLGNALQKSKRFDAAISAYEKAIAARPDFADAHHNLGNALAALGRREDAARAIEAALAIDPENSAACNDLAALRLVLGRIEDACDAYERAVTLDPRNTLIHLDYAAAKPFSPGDPRLAALETLAGQPDGLAARERIALHFALGRAYDDVGDAERAFGHLRLGNEAKRAQIDYDETGELLRFHRIRAVFSKEAIGALRGLGAETQRPVFVVGMPRSGTTLIEQILASHSQVFAAGEIAAFSRAAEAMGRYPEALSGACGADLKAVGEAYLAAVAEKAGAAARIIDKMPANFAFVGLIHLALPQARIIWARRDAIDTCLSCWSLLFSEAQPHTYDLAELGRYHRAYDRLMRHWTEVLPQGVMIPVDYEEVVADLEGQTRRMLAHCGLDFEPACLAFHETQRPVQTASVRQVRQKLYASSVGRWRPYAARLAPLLRELGVHAD